MRISNTTRRAWAEVVFTCWEINQ